MRPLTRRAFLGGALGAGLATSGCAGLTSRVSTTSRGSRDRLSVQVYGTDTEHRLYDRLARRFEEQHRGISVDLRVVPFQEASTGIDSGLLSGTAPDVFRVDYPTMGLYASTEQLLDVTDETDSLVGDASEAFLGAVSFAGRRYGVPQHVDTTALLYRPDALRRAGIRVPDRPQDAWTWEEFGDVAQRLTDQAPEGRSAFAVNWQELGAFRWLTWLFMAGGHVYDRDLRRSLLDEEPGRRALDFTRSFFERGWVPRASSTKSATTPDVLFAAGRLSMLFAGNFLIPAFADTIARRFDYRATYQPRDRRRASELGGNALVATRSATNPELAAEFLTFMAAPRQMLDFCEACVLLPSRRTLLERRLRFPLGADLMGVYADQLGTIEDRDVADVTTPSFAEVNDALADDLEDCFLGGRSAGATLSSLRQQVDESAALNAGAGRS